MRRIFDQLEQFRRLTESPVQKIIEQQERLRRLTASPIQRMIEQQNELLRHISEPLSSEFSVLAELQKTANVAQDTLKQTICRSNREPTHQR